MPSCVQVKVWLSKATAARVQIVGGNFLPLLREVAEDKYIPVRPIAVTSTISRYCASPRLGVRVRWRGV